MFIDAISLVICSSYIQFMLRKEQIQAVNENLVETTCKKN